MSCISRQPIASTALKQSVASRYTTYKVSMRWSMKQTLLQYNLESLSSSPLSDAMLTDASHSCFFTGLNPRGFPSAYLASFHSDKLGCLRSFLASLSLHISLTTNSPCSSLHAANLYILFQLHCLLSLSAPFGTDGFRYKMPEDWQIKNMTRNSVKTSDWIH